jgi:hypothetical protein
MIIGVQEERMVSSTADKGLTRRERRAEPMTRTTRGNRDAGRKNVKNDDAATVVSRVKDRHSKREEGFRGQGSAAGRVEELKEERKDARTGGVR